MREIAHLMQQHYHKSGSFRPFCYAVGLEASPSASLKGIQKYPLRHPESISTLKAFGKSLAFVHETTHMAQYLSSAAGLRSLRGTLTCLSYLFQRRDWQLPIFEFLARRARRRELDEFQEQAFLRFLIILDLVDQLRIQVGERSLEKPLSDLQAYIYWEEWSPHLPFLLVDETKSREEILEKIDKMGGLVRKIPHIRIRHGNVETDVILNVALLMEAFAAIAELNHLHNAFQDQLTVQELYDIIPKSIPYVAPLIYALEMGACTITNLASFAICIDLALMYDPLILFGSDYWDKPEDGGMPDCYPGETFVRACKVSGEIKAISCPEDVPRFYKDLCKALKMPSPRSMAKRTFDVAKKMLARNPNPNAFLRKALAAHCDCLYLRLESAEEFPKRLATCDGILDALEVGESCLTFFNLRRKKPEIFDARKVDVLTLHNIVWQMLTRGRIDCPLKYGEPFFCPYGSKNPSVVCYVRTDFGAQVCPVYVLENRCLLKSGGEG